MTAKRCPEENWHPDEPRTIRCTQRAGHEGPHHFFTEFWGFVWPDDNSHCEFLRSARERAAKSRPNGR